jgi:hypothetical protein
LNRPPIWTPPTNAAPHETNITCAQCGYNLRGLEADGLCPECGQPIAISLRGHRLVRSDPAWLNRVAHGLVIRCWTLLLCALVAAVTTVLLTSISRNYSPQLMTLLFAGSIGSDASLFLLFIADWQISAPEPDRTNRENRRTLRFGLRVLLWSNLTAAILKHFLGNSGIYPGIPSGAIYSYSLFAFGVELTRDILLLLYLRRFSLRIPDSPAVRQWLVLLWVMVVEQSLFAGIVIFLVLKEISMFDSWGIKGMKLGAVAAVLALGLAVWQFVLLLRLRKQLLAAAAGHLSTPATVPAA